MDFGTTASVPAPPRSRNDRLLVTGARNQVPGATDELVDRYYAAVYHYMLAMTASPDIATELTQETFTLALKHLGQLLDASAFGAWLFRIAHNCWATRERRVLQRRFVSLDWLMLRSAGPSAYHPAIESHGERALVQQTMNRLHTSYREVLLLRHIQGFTNTEVAGILGITAENARRRLHRAERQFRKLYQRLDGGSLPSGAIR